MSGLPEKYKGAYSIENRAAFGAEDREIKKVDEVVLGDWKYIYYKDDEGQYWFENLIRKGNRFVSMKEAIFGKAQPKPYRKK